MVIKDLLTYLLKRCVVRRRYLAHRRVTSDNHVQDMCWVLCL